MVYCDGLHLMADNLDELHLFAKKLGMKKEWFQDKPNHPHYDLFGSKVKKAFELGAKKINGKELIILCRDKYGYKPLIPEHYL